MSFKGCLLVTVITVVITEILSLQGEPPFCRRCTCEGDASNRSINCARSNVDDLLYQRSSWFDDKNVSFAVLGINLQHTNLTKLDTPFIISDLYVLDLSNNSIRNISKGVFANLQEMELLILSNNEIEYLEPDVFKGYYRAETYYPLQSLKKLILANNKLHSLHQDLFEHTTRIENLVLRGNPLTVIDIQTQTAISSLSHLQNLDLSDTQLKSLPEGFLHTPKYLKVLHLSWNFFESIPPQLEECQYLEVLHFNGNPIKNLTHKTGLPHLKSLRVLMLCNMSTLEEVGPHTFGYLRSLKELHITDNSKLHKISPVAFVKKDHGHKVYPNIQKLYLQNNNLSHIDRHLFLWQELHDLDLSGNPWDCSCNNHWLIYNLTKNIEINKENQSYHKRIRMHHAKKFRCSSPAIFKNHSILEMSTNRTLIHCTIQTAASVHSYVLVGIISAILFVVLVAGILIFMHRRNHINYSKLTNYAYMFRTNREEGN